MDFARRKPALAFVQQRAEMRERVFMRIGKLLAVHDKVLAECTIHDMSSKGVRVKLLCNEAMPQRFRFFDFAGRYTRMSRLAWQDGRRTGVRFISAPIMLNELDFQTLGRDWQP